MEAPPPSRSAFPIVAYAMAETFAPTELLTWFPPSAHAVQVRKTLALVRYEAGGWAAAYDFGALVFIGVDAEERARVLGALRAAGKGGARAPTEETFLIEVQPDAVADARYDRVIVPSMDEVLVELVSLVVGQSVAMEYFETDVVRLLGQLKAFARTLATKGGLRRRTRDLLRFVGQGMSTRNEVLLTLSLLDTPQLVWERGDLDRLYRGLRHVFEIEDRYRALDHELAIVQDNLTLLVDLTHQRRSLWIEAAVAILVAVEVFAALRAP
jgi:uncharacterized Rmd1/YagE family protein